MTSAKHSNLRIIKTTAATATKFCTTIKTYKYSLWVVPKSKMADSHHLVKK